MNKKKNALAAGLLAATTLSVGSTSRANTFNEVTDVGQTLATATDTRPLGATGTSLTSITGTIGTLTDADLYEITIGSAAAFNATTFTLTTTGSGLDTELFLFDAAGNAIAVNDDTSGTNFTSTLPLGNALYATLPAGTYYLGVSTSGNEAVNSVNQLLFAGVPGGDTTAIRGTAAGLNPTTESNFNGLGSNQTGAYQITFAVPEPSTWAITILGAATASFTLLRRRSNRIA